MAKRRDEFVTGWPWSTMPVQGKGGEPYVHPLTAIQALQRKQRYRRKGMEGPTIYRLIEAPPAEVERQAARERKARKR